MLLIFALLYLSRSVIRAAPVSPALGEVNPANLLLAPGQCQCPDQLRSIWDIIWSCLATMFACSWVSVHPNMPAPGEKSGSIAWRRLEVMFWAIIAPETIILWAMRQWYGARKLAKKYHAQEWKKTHGYFIQMGGFTLYKGKEFKGVLSPERMENLLKKGQIEFPIITEEEIRDRSKGDGLSKALVIGQTSWFVMQCIARRVQGLDITELELVTSAFATLNGVMYFLWWNKPLDVRCSVPIQLLDTPKEPFKFELGTENQATLFKATFSLIGHLYRGLRSNGISFWHKVWEVIKTKGVGGILKVIILSPWIVISAIFSELYSIAENELVEEGHARVPTFYAFFIPPSERAWGLVPVLASIIALIFVFGAIHCAGWNFIFPSHAELILWRVCSTTITGISFLMAFLVVVPSPEDLNPIVRIIFTPVARAVLFGLPIYVIARLLLLAEALVALRNLPPGAYEVVKWTTFIPHI